MQSGDCDCYGRLRRRLLEWLQHFCFKFTCYSSKTEGVLFLKPTCLYSSYGCFCSSEWPVGSTPHLVAWWVKGLQDCWQLRMNTKHLFVTWWFITRIQSLCVMSAAPGCARFILPGPEVPWTGGERGACKMVPWFARGSNSSPTLLIESLFPTWVFFSTVKRSNYDKLVFSVRKPPLSHSHGQRLLVKAAPSASQALHSLRYGSRDHGNASRLLSWSDCPLPSSWDAYQARWADIKHSSQALVPSTADIGAAKQFLITWA